MLICRKGYSKNNHSLQADPRSKWRGGETRDYRSFAGITTEEFPLLTQTKNEIAPEVNGAQFPQEER
jgi:hypothetical protein